MSSSVSAGDRLDVVTAGDKGEMGDGALSSSVTAEPLACAAWPSEKGSMGEEAVRRVPVGVDLVRREEGRRVV
jgi:hypothetical protein